jgi:flagellin-like hook-associated protein FlgL
MNIATTSTADALFSKLSMARPADDVRPLTVTDANAPDRAIQADTFSVSDEVHTLLLKDKVSAGAQMIGFVSIAGDALDTVSDFLNDIKDHTLQLESGNLTADEASTLSGEIEFIEKEMSAFIGTLYHDNNLNIQLQSYSEDIDDSFLDIISLSDGAGDEVGSIAAVEVDFKSLVAAIHYDHIDGCPHCVGNSDLQSSQQQQRAQGQYTPLEATITSSTAGSDAVANASGDDNQSIIDTLLLGSKWDIDTTSGEKLTYSYYDPATSGYDPNYAGGGGLPGGAAIHSVNSQDSGNETALNTMFSLWDDVLAIDFEEVDESSGSDDVGELRVAFTDDGEQYGRAAFAYAPGNSAFSGDIWFETADNSAFDSSGIGSDGYSFRSALHEAGHAIGLSHPFGDGSSVTGTALPDEQDIMRNTLMSYTNVDRNQMFTVTVNDDNGSNTYTYDELENITTTGSYSVSYGFTDVSASTPMLYDILTGQYLYGAAEDTRTGDDNYSFTDTPQTIQTIYDSDGTDTIDASAQTRSSEINLAAGAFSSIGRFTATEQLSALNSNLSGVYDGIVSWLDTANDNRSDAVSSDMNAASLLYSGEDNVAIAYGVEIENALGGAGDDTITGNNLNNLLVGNGGDDTLDGGTGDADVAKFRGARDDYTISTAGSVTTIVDGTAGRDGTDTISNVEYLEFTGATAGFVQFDATLQNFTTDVTFDLTVDGVSKTVTLATKDYTSGGLTLQDFASDLDTAIDGAFGTETVGVTVNSPLTITSNSTGTSSGVSISNASDATLQSALGISDANGTGALQSSAGQSSAAQYYDIAAGTVGYATPSGAAGAGTPGSGGVGGSGSSGSSGNNVGSSGEVIYAGSVASIDLSSAEGATRALAVIDRALENITSVRSNLGAIENRLDYAISNMGNMMVHTQASQSAIEDADFAVEMSKFVKAQVLQQAAMQLLGRANQAPQGTLSLLQG